MEARQLVRSQGLFFLNKFVLLEWKQSVLYLKSAPSPRTPPCELAAEQKATGTRSHHGFPDVRPRESYGSSELWTRIQISVANRTLGSEVK